MRRSRRRHCRSYLRDGDAITDIADVIGYAPPEHFHSDAVFIPSTLVATPLLLEWAKLVRFYHSTSLTPVQVGVVNVPDHDLSDVQVLAAKTLEDDKVVAVAPRVDHRDALESDPHVETEGNGEVTEGP